MEHGASSFVLEMKEIMYIMATMTDNSLILIDELCRSTSVEEGTALAIAIVEKLAQSSAFIYVTTHFTQLTKLYDMYLNIKLWQLETPSSGDDPKTFKLDFRHSLTSGVSTVKRYGVYIVRNIWADRILTHVDELLVKISRKPENLNIVPIDAKIRLKYKLEAEFRKLKSLQKLTLSEVHKLLNEYQIELEKLGSFLGAFEQKLPRTKPSRYPRGRIHGTKCTRFSTNKRDLDQLTSDFTASNEESDNKTKESEKGTSSSKEGDGDENMTDKPQECEPRSRERGRKSKKPVIRPRKFIPPRKLTAKEIKKEFRVQDRKFLASNPSSSTYSAYVKQLINRPSVKQLQKMTHVALVRKTEEGVEVIPAEPRRKKDKTTAWKKNRSTDGFDVTIFSDKKASTFENYLNSNEKDYDTFAFNFNRNRAAEKVFNFEPGPLTFGDDTGQSVSQRFLRTVSEMSCEQQSRKTTELENRNVTLCVSEARIDNKLTKLKPNGFYKQNKEEIAMIVGRYLSNEEEGVPGGIIGRTMFESSDVDENNLEI